MRPTYEKSSYIRNVSTRYTYHIEFFISVTVVGSLVKRTMDIGKSSPISTKIIRHNVNRVEVPEYEDNDVDGFIGEGTKARQNHSLAEFWNVITFVETELGHRYGHCDLPAFSFFIESTFKFFNEVEEIVLIGEFATSVRGTRVLPVEIETVELVFVHEFCNRNE